MKFDNNIPIYLQVINHLKHQIVVGTLTPGDKLPSTRELALKFDINPNTASRIYKEMERENICYTKRGLGTYVTDDLQKIHSIRTELAHKLTEDFITGMINLGYTTEDLINIIKNRK